MSKKADDVRELVRTDLSFQGKYKGHYIVITRDKSDEDWYITVSSDEGYAYDGWWQDSAEATINQAIQEAIEGAML